MTESGRVTIHPGNYAVLTEHYGLFEITEEEYLQFPEAPPDTVGLQEILQNAIETGYL